ncbi:DUF1102 domain-containing protein [Thermococcus sp. GR6]|uniref:DUF1102 domain-containing protein n=1 Tax=Thermococcus sp. GR6 TaxID=1638256 RepID=UPI0014321210|nr:DUF1102 domain-containing protein [Thermococcus sp. GR6]NJE42846.1 DUF1102 domain-containing protein [Thermococcus sp. GR6]
MRTITNIFVGIGIIIFLIMGLEGMYPSEPITVAYATPDGDNVSIENPLPPYAYSSDGIIVVDISPNNPFYPGWGDGLSVNSIYVFEDVFLIENNQSETGYNEICVRISSNSPEIGFFLRSFNGNWSEVVEATILANESIGVGMSIDTHGLPLEDYSDEISIEAWGGSCR